MVIAKLNRDFGGHMSQIPFSQICSMVLTQTVKVSDSTMFPPKNAWSDANLRVPGAARLCLNRVCRIGTYKPKLGTPEKRGAKYPGKKVDDTDMVSL